MKIINFLIKRWASFFAPKKTTHTESDDMDLVPHILLGSMWIEFLIAVFITFILV